MNLKRIIKNLLPPAFFEGVQSVRRRFAKPDPQVEADRARFLALQGGAGSDQIVLRPDLTLTIDPDSRAPFQWFCYQSPEMVRELDSFLEEAVRFRRFVDVGANHGVFSLCYLKRVPEGIALAVDPSPVAFRILTHNRELNTFENLRALNVACGDEEGTVSMRANWHHLEVVISGSTDGAEPTVEVPMARLDTLCQRENFWPDVVKIDVEGFERQVLEGAAETLSRVELLYLEVHPDLIEKLGYRTEAIFDTLERLRFNAFDLDGQVLTRAFFRDRMHTFWTICRPARQPSLLSA